MIFHDVSPVDVRDGPVRAKVVGLTIPDLLAGPLLDDKLLPVPGIGV